MSAAARSERAGVRDRASRDTTICVFAKPPRPGAVKTRVAAAIGPERAAELARALLADSWRAVSAVPWARAIVASTQHDDAFPGEVWLQGDGDLGMRLERVLRRALAGTPYAVAVGADSPGLPAESLAAARDALRSHDAVIGPAADGGFYLLGVRCCPPRLLAHLPWSTDATCERTVAALHTHGLTVARIAPWFDVDRVEDLDRVRQLLACDALEAPAVQALLTSWATRLP